MQRITSRTACLAAVLLLAGCHDQIVARDAGPRFTADRVLFQLRRGDVQKAYATLGGADRQTIERENRSPVRYWWLESETKVGDHKIVYRYWVIRGFLPLPNKASITVEREPQSGWRVTRAEIPF